MSRFNGFYVNDYVYKDTSYKPDVYCVCEIKETEDSKMIFMLYEIPEGIASLPIDPNIEPYWLKKIGHKNDYPELFI